MKKGLLFIGFCTALILAGLAPPRAVGNPVFSHAPILRNFDASEEQIAAVVLAMNATEIMEARVVLYSFIYNMNQTMSDYAKNILNDSKYANFNAAVVYRRNNIVPEENSMSGDLLSRATDRCTYYNTLTRPDFYKTFAHDQVGAYQAFLLTLNYLLIEHAKNPEMKSFLQQMVKMIQDHLKKAEELTDIFY